MHARGTGRWTEITHELQREYLRPLLEQCEGRVSRLAAHLQVNRTQLYRVLWRLGIVKKGPPLPPRPHVLNVQMPRQRKRRRHALPQRT